MDGGEGERMIADSRAQIAKSSSGMFEESKDIGYYW
jgi:hypothetical protein